MGKALEAALAIASASPQTKRFVIIVPACPVEDEGVLESLSRRYSQAEVSVSMISARSMPFYIRVCQAIGHETKLLLRNESDAQRFVYVRGLSFRAETAGTAPTGLPVPLASSAASSPLVTSQPSPAHRPEPGTLLRPAVTLASGSGPHPAAQLDPIQQQHLIAALKEKQDQALRNYAATGNQMTMQDLSMGPLRQPPASYMQTSQQPRSFTPLAAGPPPAAVHQSSSYPTPTPTPTPMPTPMSFGSPTSRTVLMPVMQATVPPVPRAGEFGSSLMQPNGRAVRAPLDPILAPRTHTAVHSVTPISPSTQAGLQQRFFGNRAPTSSPAPTTAQAPVPAPVALGLLASAAPPPPHLNRPRPAPTDLPSSADAT